MGVTKTEQNGKGKRSKKFELHVMNFIDTAAYRGIRFKTKSKPWF